MKLYMSDLKKNNKINQAPALPFYLDFVHFILRSIGSRSGCLPEPPTLPLTPRLFHVPPPFIRLPPEVISRVYGRQAGEEGRLSCPRAAGLG